jgi:uncharacterized protein (TIGR03067 family)
LTVFGVGENWGYFRNMKPAIAVLLIAIQASFIRADGPTEKKASDLDGTWVIVSSEDDGSKAPEDQLKAAKLIFKGNQITWLYEGKETCAIGYWLSPAKNPKGIVVSGGFGAGLGFRAEGIYAVEGDTFRICVSSDEEKRPTTFSAKKGSNAWLLTLKRTKQ